MVILVKKGGSKIRNPLSNCNKENRQDSSSKSSNNGWIHAMDHEPSDDQGESNARHIFFLIYSWENPLGLSRNIGPCDLESGEQFVGDELRAFFDKEEKLYQSASSVKSDQSHQTEKSNQSMVSGITLRSFMVESGDSDLIQQKLTMSQYLAYKSEAMGPELGDSASFRERPYFSFQDKSLQSTNSEKSEPGVAEFNPDFSQEPSWMRKKSLSSLSSSENLEILSKMSSDSSENWLIGKNKSTSQSNLMDSIEKSCTSTLYIS